MNWKDDIWPKKFEQKSAPSSIGMDLEAIVVTQRSWSSRLVMWSNCYEDGWCIQIELDYNSCCSSNISWSITTDRKFIVVANLYHAKREWQHRWEMVGPVVEFLIRSVGLRGLFLVRKSSLDYLESMLSSPLIAELMIEDQPDQVSIENS